MESPQRSHTETGAGSRHPLVAAQGARAPERRPARQALEVQQTNRSLYRAFLLREEPRLLYHLDDPALAPAHLDAWLTWASRSQLAPFVKLAARSAPTATASALGLFNGRIKGLNSKIRLISTAASAFAPPAC
jgi:transposase